METRRINTKKPNSDRVHIRKPRSCLMCSRDFMSGFIGERVCPSCKEKAVWRSGGITT